MLACPGTYPEQVVINTPLTLKGVVSGNHGAAVITVPASGLVPNGTFGGGTAVAQVFVQAASGSVTIADLTVDGSAQVVPQWDR